MMNDPVKNNANTSQFSPSSFQKVPAMICTNRTGFLNFNLGFADFEILAAHLLKSDEWIYGIYYGDHYYGYVYHGENLNLEKQFACVRDFLPQSRSLLNDLVKKWDGKVEYHKSAPDAFAIIGEYEGKPVIQKPKKLIDNYNTNGL